MLSKTQEIYKFLNEKVKCIYEENVGNHFKDGEVRITKGIKWILE